MKTTTISKALSLLLCLVLLAAAVSVAAGCGGNVPVPAESVQESVPETQVQVRGEGSKVFAFKVTYQDGKTDSFEIHTEEKTVGDALVKLGLIEGTVGDYGLYVKKVNGVTADYDVDGTYWAFYVNGAYASSGVDSTDVTAGAEYAFKVEK